MKKHLSVAFLLSMLALLPVRSYADDRDGNYCISKGYIAFDLARFMTPGLSAPHLLRVVRFEPGRGIYQGGDVAMQEFDVASMNCTSGQIRLSGQSRDLKSHESYVIDVSDDQEAPRVLQHSSEPVPRGFIPKVDVAPAGVFSIPVHKLTSLESNDTEHQYQLVSSSHQVSGDGCYVLYTKTELFRRDLQGNIVDRVVLYEFVHELCGE